MVGINYTCQGESHKATDKVCQDYSYCSVKDELSIAIVCDGHGGEHYFRSNIGAEIATNVTVDCVTRFVNQIDSELFQSKPFTQKSANTTEAANLSLLTKQTQIDDAFAQLFSSIIFNWSEQISQHASTTPTSEWEKSNVPQKYLDKLSQNVNIEKIYGCTLMCYVQTPTYWFAFQIGDGKCFAFTEDGKWLEPIPWDEQCFLNKTTSMCDSRAIDEFRYCYQGDGTYPMAIFLGSDGIDDSFGANENIVNFYIQILKLFLTKSVHEVEESLHESLPQLSKIGSKDDMSISCILNEKQLPITIQHLIKWQLDLIGAQITLINKNILKYKEDIAKFEAQEIKSQKEMIDFQYAQKELDRLFVQKSGAVQKWNKIAEQFSPDTFTPYKDEIGLNE